VHFDLPDPISNVIERFFRCAIICKNDSHSSLIISLSNSSESLLPGSVPNLKFDILAIDVDCLNLEVNTYNPKVKNYSLTNKHKRAVFPLKTWGF
jgi:hypothetical protein